MMGRRQTREPKLFYTGVDLEDRVPADHPLRRIEQAIDFSFVREAVAERYGRVGHPSIDPIVLLKLMFLLFYENVSSERALAKQLPMRLDWLWFCGFDLDSDLPNHSVLSKARRRWGVALFERFFAHVLSACVEAGLVDASVAYADGSVIEADASPQTVQRQLCLQGQQLYEQLETAERAPADEPAAYADVEAEADAEARDQANRSADAPASSDPAADTPAQPARDDEPEPGSSSKANAGDQAAHADDAEAADAQADAEATGNTDTGDTAVDTADPDAGDTAEQIPAGTRLSPTDPDARFTRKYGQPTLGYKDHRMVDDRVGIITATLTTHAAAAEADCLIELIDLHEDLLQTPLQTIVADKGYGTAENYQALHERDVTPCIPHKKPTEAADGKFRRSDFHYDPSTDTYRCPAGQTLHRRGEPSDNRHRYKAAQGVCAACELRAQCTDNKHGRLLSRHVLQDAIDRADHAHSPPQRRRLMRRRKAIGEGSFADAANRHGYKRMRWRGRRRATIQNLMIAATQNLRKLLRHSPRSGPRPALTTAARRATSLLNSRWAHSLASHRPCTVARRPTSFLTLPLTLLTTSFDLLPRPTHATRPCPL